MKSHVKNVIDAKPKSRPINPLAPSGTTRYNIQVSVFYAHGILFSKYTAIISLHITCKVLVFVMQMVSLLYEAGI
jgi:hypothetical protein